MRVRLWFRPWLIAAILLLQLAAWPAASDAARPGAPAAQPEPGAAAQGAVDRPRSRAVAPLMPAGTTGASATATATPTFTISPTPSPTAPATPSATAPAPTASATATVTNTATPIPSASASETATPAVSATASGTATPPPTTSTPTPTSTPIITPPFPLPTSQPVLAAPLSFVPNVGQTDPRVAFLAQGPGYSLYLTHADAVLTLVQAPPPAQQPLTGPAPAPVTGTEEVLDLHPLGANASPPMVGQQPLPGSANYFLGNNPAAWHSNVSTYGQVVYQGVYAGVDLLYGGRNGALEYTWQLAAGANPGLIQLAISGTQGISLDSQGNLMMQTALGPIEQPVPDAYQVVNGLQRPVAIQYTLSEPSTIGFALGNYDPNRPLTIDPVLSYSTYLGGSGSDSGSAIAVDAVGNAYVTGSTASTNFITTTGAFSTTFIGSEDVFVTKLSAKGNVPLYSTFLGNGYVGSSNYASGIAVDGAGNAYVIGTTRSSDFPTTPNAYQGTHSKGPAAVFVAELNPNVCATCGPASLVYSTYLGGGSADSGNAIAVDGAGKAYVTGTTYSTDFPTTTNAFSRTIGGTHHGGFGGNTYSAFVAELNLNLSGSDALVYSTYLGGSGTSSGNGDFGQGIALDVVGNVHVIGTTYSADFPTTTDAYSRTLSGVEDAFVATINTTVSGTAGLVYSTYLGGGGFDSGNGIAVDRVGNVYVTGQTQSSDFPTVNALQGSCGDLGCTNGGDAFVTKIAPYASGGTVPWHPHDTLRLTDHLSASVDLSDGHLDLSLAGMRVPGLGLDLAVNSTWDSAQAQAGATGLQGQGWFSTLTQSMGGALTQTVLYTDGSGAVWPFYYTGPLTATAPYTTYAPPPGQPWQLSTSTAGYILTNLLTNEALVFDASGRLLSDTDAYGNADTLAYTGTAAQPVTLTNSGGRALSLYYTPGGQLSAVQSPLDRASEGQQGQFVAYGDNPAGQLATVAWGYGTPDQAVATFGYSGTQLMTITTPAGHVWRVGYDPLGRVQYLATQGETDAFGYGHGYTVVVAGYGSAAPVTTTYVLDGQGEPIAIQDGLGHTEYRHYDADHDVTYDQDANDHTTHAYYQYVGPSANYGLITETLQPSITPYTQSDSLQPVLTGYHYSPSNDLTEVDSPNGGRTLFGYDAHHSVITTTQLLAVSGCGTSAPRRPGAPAQPNCTPTYSWRASLNGYNQYGDLVSTVDPRGLDVGTTSAPGQDPPVSVDPLAGPANTWTWGYDAQGDLTATSTAPLTTSLGGQSLVNTPVTTTIGPDLDGHPITVTTPNGASTLHYYDALGRLVARSQPFVAVAGGGGARPLETWNYDGDLTGYAVDALGRVTAMTNPVNGTSLYTYTGSELSATQDPAGNVTQIGYDAAGRPISTTDATAATTQYGYDNVGNTVAITRPLDYSYPLTVSVETRQYDALNEPITETVAGSGEVTPTAPQSSATGYDLDGDVVQQQAPDGNAVFTKLDAADRLQQAQVYATSVSQPGTPLATEAVNLDVADNPLDSFDYNLYDHSDSFDAANRLTQEADCQLACLLPGSVAITTTPTYDPDGNVLSLARQDSTQGGGQTGSYAATYNALDWLRSASDGVGEGGAPYTTAYGYDAAGRLVTQSLLGGARTGLLTDTLNPEGLAVTTTAVVTDSGQVPLTTTNAFSYTPDDLPLTDTLDAGGAGQVQVSRTYDGDNRLTCQQNQGPVGGQTPLARSDQYSYSPLGVTTAISTYAGTLCGSTKPTSAQSLGYDALGRLSGSSDGSAWGYDGDGNLLVVTRPSGAAPQIARRPRVRPDVAAAVPLSLTYSYANPAGSGGLPNELLATHYFSATGPTYSTFAYDPSGNVSTEVITPEAQATITRTLRYNAQSRLAGVATACPVTSPGAPGAPGRRPRPEG